MLPVQKVIQAYSATLNSDDKRSTYSRNDLKSSESNDKQSQKELKKKFEQILERAMKNRQ